MIAGDPDFHFARVTRPALLLAPATFLGDIRVRLAAAGVIEAIARHDSAPIVDYVLSFVGLQGISDAAAFAYAEQHGHATFAEIDAGLAARPSCPRLRHYWAFRGCGYRKAAATCGEPCHLPRCPLPTHPLRNTKSL